jgi:hypothetical protein
LNSVEQIQKLLFLVLKCQLIELRDTMCRDSIRPRMTPRLKTTIFEFSRAGFLMQKLTPSNLMLLILLLHSGGIILEMVLI